MYMGILPCFSIIFMKGNHFCGFLFAFLNDAALPNWGLLSEEQILTLI